MIFHQVNASVQLTQGTEDLHMIVRCILNKYTRFFLFIIKELLRPLSAPNYHTQTFFISGPQPGGSGPLQGSQNILLWDHTSRNARQHVDVLIHETH